MSNHYPLSTYLRTPSSSTVCMYTPFTPVTPPSVRNKINQLSLPYTGSLMKEQFDILISLTTSFLTDDTLLLSGRIRFENEDSSPVSGVLLLLLLKHESYEHTLIDTTYSNESGNFTFVYYLLSMSDQLKVVAHKPKQSII